MRKILRRPKFTKFKKWMLSYLILLHSAFPNTSFVNFVRSNDVLLASVEFHISNTIYMGVEQVGVQFITCDMLRRSSLSLIGYFSAFYENIWIFLVALVLATFVSIKLFKSNFFNRNDDFSPFAPIFILLEQGIALPRHNRMQIVAIVWVLMGVILGNSYKGQNITDLSAPLPLIPIEYFFKQLLDLNFTIFSRQLFAPDENVIDTLLALTINDQKLEDEYGGNVELYMNHSKKEWENSKIDMTVLEHVAKELTNISSYNDLAKLVKTNLHAWTNGDISHKIMKKGVPEGYLKHVDNCHKSAYASWSDEVEESVPILKRLVYKANIFKKRFADVKDVVESVTTGKDILGKVHKTWRIFG